MIRTAIVILNFNGVHFLKKFLPSVSLFTDHSDDIVFVVDNGSSDDSVNFVRSEFPQVNLIEFSVNYGFARGYFNALQQIEAKYYVLLNSDVEVTRGWLEPMVRAMEADPNLGACMPKMRDYNNRAYFEYAGAAGGFIDILGYPFCRGRLLNNVEADAGQYDDERDIFWASGACMFLRASAYERTGGLDGDFFAHMEEIDLCWRLRRLGFGIRIIPASTVYHVGGGTLPNNNPHKLYLNYRNNLYLLFKNLGLVQLPLVLVRMMLDGMSAMVYLFSGSFGFFMAVLKAHGSFYISIPSLVRKRHLIRVAIGKASVEAIYPRSILIEFFVRKNRVFSKLQW
jgi:GT2 family glycosyltransferase